MAGTLTVQAVLDQPGRSLHYVYSPEPVKLVCAVMAQAKETAVIVAESVPDGDAYTLRLLGIVSEGDILHHLLRERSGLTAVGDVMTRDVVTVTPDASLLTVGKLMLEHGFRHVPVVDTDGTPLGMLTIHDVLGPVVEHLEDELSWFHAAGFTA